MEGNEGESQRVTTLLDKENRLDGMAIDRSIVSDRSNTGHTICWLDSMDRMEV